jgi:hypothetical protein
MQKACKQFNGRLSFRRSVRLFAAAPIRRHCVYRACGSAALERCRLKPLKRRPDGQLETREELAAQRVVLP